MSVWGEDSGFLYETFALDTSSEFFTPFSSIMNTWRSKINNGPIPLKANLNFEDFIGWYGKICFAQINRKPEFSVSIGLFGTDYVRLFGGDFTGLSSGEIPTEEFDSDFDLSYYEYLAEEKRIGRSSGIIDGADGESYNVTYLGLPLSNDGQSVDWFLYVVNYSPLTTEELIKHRSSNQ